jgi:hypothetical protein
MVENTAPFYLEQRVDLVITRLAPALSSVSAVRGSHFPSPLGVVSFDTNMLTDDVKNRFNFLDLN